MSVRSRRRRVKPAKPVACAPVSALAGLPVGPGLAAALAQLALPALTGHELVLALQARHRQANHERAMLTATVAEVIRRVDPGFGMADEELPVGGSS